MANYNIGDMININNTDFCILDIIPYKYDKYVIATEYIEKIIMKKPQIIMLKEVQNDSTGYGAYFDLISNQKEIESVLKNLEI